MSVPQDDEGLWTKLRQKGLAGSCRALGRTIHSFLFRTRWDFELVPSLLNSLASRREQVVIVQIGANVGNTASDPLYHFLIHQRDLASPSGGPHAKAVLVEPVPALFQQLALNYRSVPGVFLENLAIAESAGMRTFYGLRPGIDLVAHGLPPWSYQLGSFLPNQTESFMVLHPRDPGLRAFVEQNIVPEPIRCETLSGLCATHDLSRIDFLQIDTEGYDYRVLQGLNFEKILPRFINYERIHLKKEEAACRRFLTKKGYVLLDHGQDTLATWCREVPLAEKIKEWFYCRWLEMIF